MAKRKIKAKRSTWNLKAKLTSSIRKIWRTSPLKQLAMELACVDKTIPARERLYICANCGKACLAQSVDVDHVRAAEKGELLNTFVNRLFCGIDKVTYDEEGNMTTEYAGRQTTLQEVIAKQLKVLCLTCHKEKTKREAQERKKK